MQDSIICGSQRKQLFGNEVAQFFPVNYRKPSKKVANKFPLLPFFLIKFSFLKMNAILSEEKKTEPGH